MKRIISLSIHLIPSELESAAGPYDRWPLGRGFERYYGFLGGDTHQYYPDLVYDNHQVEPPRTPEEGYHLNEDIAENHNVEASNREKVINMIATWYVEAGKYKVLPIDGSILQRFAQERPQLAKDRTRYTYFPDTQTVPWYASVHVLNRPHSITADVEIPTGGAEGVLLCQGTGSGGYAFYVKDDKLSCAWSWQGSKVRR